MADSKRLISFIVENANRLDLQVSNLTWFKENGIPVSDVEVTFASRKKLRRGRGTAPTSQLAIVKAFAEATERDVMNEMGWPTSNGVAAHCNLKDAKIAAKSELIERHVFFKLFGSGERFGSKKAAPKSNITSRALRTLEAAGIEIRESNFECANLNVSIVTLLGKSAQRKFGMILGSAAASDLVQAFEHALIEAMRFYARISTSNQTSSLSEAEFSRLSSPTLSDHGRLGLDLQYAEWFTNTYLTGICDSVVEEPEISYKTVDISDDGLRPPLFVVRASSSTASQLQVGYAGNPEKPHPFW